jgi:Ni/Co efflux regulator RcnB
MTKFLIATLAATALLPVSAAAQTAHAGPRPNAGVTWHGRGGNQMVQHRGANRHVVMRRGGANHMVRRDHHAMRGGKHVFRRHHGINRHGGYKRIDRGFIVPPFWWGPQFHIQNWGSYGFAQPMHDRRWVRYYDDALLIDRSGRVHDGRWGMNWDQYDGQWAYDDQGVPYDGDDEDYRDDEDYAWDGEEGRYAEDDGPPPPPPLPPCYQDCPPPMPGYGHGYSYAYPGYGYGGGWMHGGMVTITETTVHAAAPQTVTETVYVEKKVKTKPRRSYKKARPRPLPGERG